MYLSLLFISNIVSCNGSFCDLRWHAACDTATRGGTLFKRQGRTPQAAQST